MAVVGNGFVKKGWQEASPELHVGEGNFACLTVKSPREHPNLADGAGSLPAENLLDWQSGKLPARPKHSFLP